MGNEAQRSADNCPFYPGCYIAGDCNHNEWKTGKCGLPKESAAESVMGNDNREQRARKIAKQVVPLDISVDQQVRRIAKEGALIAEAQAYERAAQIAEKLGWITAYTESERAMQQAGDEIAAAIRAEALSQSQQGEGE